MVRAGGVVTTCSAQLLAQNGAQTTPSTMQRRAQRSALRTCGTVTFDQVLFQAAPGISPPLRMQPPRGGSPWPPSVTFRVQERSSTAAPNWFGLLP